jgi:hypothetical protein
MLIFLWTVKYPQCGIAEDLDGIQNALIPLEKSIEIFEVSETIDICPTTGVVEDSGGMKLVEWYSDM